MSDSQAFLLGLGTIGLAGLIGTLIMALIGNVIASLILFAGYKVLVKEYETPRFTRIYLVSLIAIVFGTFFSITFSFIFIKVGGFAAIYSLLGLMAYPQLFGFLFFTVPIFASTFAGYFLSQKLLLKDWETGPLTRTSAWMAAINAALIEILLLAAGAALSLAIPSLGSATNAPAPGSASSGDATSAAGDVPAPPSEALPTAAPVLAPVDDPSFEQAISAYDAMVVQYEQLADKDPLCQSDYLEATTKMLPELSRLSSQKPASGASPAQMQRYLDITMRFQKAMQSLQTKQPTC